MPPARPLALRRSLRCRLRLQGLRQRKWFRWRASIRVLALWPNGAPGSESKAKEEEKYRISGSPQAANDDVLIISSVHRPSITLFLPPKKIATGAAIVVAPGGAFRELWITDEGYRVGEWLSARGIAALVLKYRLPRERGSTYTMEGDSLADIQRAIRTVKSRAAEWDIDPERVGVMGFSAGGMLAGLAGTRFDEPVKHAVDGIDQVSAKPAFQALIYGTPFLGPLSVQTKIPKDTPPTFLLCGADDPVSAKYPEVFRMLKDAGVSVELHIYAGMGHGFQSREVRHLRWLPGQIDCGIGCSTWLPYQGARSEVEIFLQARDRRTFDSP